MPEFHVDVTDSSILAAELLKQCSGLPKQQLKQAMKKGAVWVSESDSGHKRLRRADKALKVGQRLHLYYDATVLAQQVEAAILIAEETEYSVWYKPYGMLSQGSKWGDHCTINRWVEQHHQPQKPAFIVNRLDRAAQGLMLVAHTKSSAAALSGLFAKRLITKQYTALVVGLFPDHLLMNTPVNNTPAISRANLLTYSTLTKQSLVNIEIETGRTHQIRPHLNGVGFPIVGDRLYGEGMSDLSIDLCLVSTYLAFECPITGRNKSYRLEDDYLPQFG
jgi:tRNA pseudouridine32 synthase/23S rRNA pseudouridine746 synthase